jgi:hypothetical protein
MKDYQILGMTTYAGKPFGIVQKPGESLKDFYERLAAIEETLSLSDKKLLYTLIRDWLIMSRNLPDPNPWWRRIWNRYYLGQR